MFWAILIILLLLGGGYWLYVKNFKVSVNANTASTVAPYTQLSNSSMDQAILACQADQRCTHAQCDTPTPGSATMCGLKQGQPQLVQRNGSSVGILQGRVPGM